MLGPLVRVTSVGNMVITLNTFQAASDLLEKRGHFASRPPWPMADLLGRQKNVAFQYYGDRLRRCRKALHASLSPTAIASQWSDLLDYYSRELLVRYMESPTSAYADSLGYVVFALYPIVCILNENAMPQYRGVTHFAISVWARPRSRQCQGVER